MGMRQGVGRPPTGLMISAPASALRSVREAPARANGSLGERDFKLDRRAAAETALDRDAAAHSSHAGA